MKRILIVLLAMLLVLAPALAACEDEKKSSKRDDDDDEDEEVLQDDDEKSFDFDFDWGDESSESDSSHAPEDGETVSGEASAETSGETSVEISDDEQSDPEQPSVSFPLEGKHFGGVEISVLTRDNWAAQQFAGTEESTYSIINAAVIARNELIEELHGIKISYYPEVNPMAAIEEQIITGMESYDIVADAVFRIVPYSIDGYFLSLNDLLNLDQPWWDQNAMNQLNPGDKIYFAAGDAIFSDDMYTSCVLFNKRAYDDYYSDTYGSLYSLVDNNKWTLDVMYEMAKGFSRPDDAGQWMNEDAYYGIVTDGYTGATMLTHGSGAVSACKDADGTIRLSGGDEISVRAFDKVYEMLSDTTTSVYAEQFSPTNWNYCNTMFATEHALFYVGYLSTLQSKSMWDTIGTVEAGIVPIPKYSSMQENYHCGINVYQSEVLAIPVTSMSRLEATAYALDLLGYYSMKESVFGDYSVTSAVQAEFAQTMDDARMMDIISHSRIYDIGAVFNWGGSLAGLYSFNLFRGFNAYVSTWDVTLPTIQEALEDTLEAYENSLT